jgi:hypothetical protein
MSVQGVSRTCRLKRFEFPKYWEEIVENLASAEQVVARIKELYAAYQSKEGEGISFSLQDDQGNKLHVGCSDEGWVVMYDPIEGVGSIAVGNKRARGHKPFLFPEWTDFERRHLVDPGIAEAIVRLWVETGRLSDAVTWVA